MYKRQAIDERANGQVYNLGSEEVVNLEDLATMLTQLHPGSSYALVPFPTERQSIDIGDYYADYAKIKADLDWHPQTNLAEGLRQTLNYYSNNLPNYL